MAKHLCSPRPSHLPDLCFPCIAACRDRAEVPPFPWELDPSGRSHCQKPSCHPRTAVCSPLAGSAVSPRLRREELEGFGVVGAPGWHRDFTTAGFVAVPPQLMLAHSSAFKAQHCGTERAPSWDAEAQQTAGKYLQGWTGKQQEQAKKKRRRR